MKQLKAAWELFGPKPRTRAPVVPTAALPAGPRARAAAIAAPAPVVPEHPVALFARTNVNINALEFFGPMFLGFVSENFTRHHSYIGHPSRTLIFPVAYVGVKLGGQYLYNLYRGTSPAPVAPVAPAAPAASAAAPAPAPALPAASAKKAAAATPAKKAAPTEKTATADKKRKDPPASASDPKSTKSSKKRP